MPTALAKMKVAEPLNYVLNICYLMYKYVSICSKNEMKMSADFCCTFPDLIFFLTDDMSLIISFTRFLRSRAVRGRLEPRLGSRGQERSRNPCCASALPAAVRTGAGRRERGC